MPRAALNIPGEGRVASGTSPSIAGLISGDELIPRSDPASGPLAWRHPLRRRMVCWSMGGALGADEAGLASGRPSAGAVERQRYPPGLELRERLAPPRFLGDADKRGRQHGLAN